MIDSLAKGRLMQFDASFRALFLCSAVLFLVACEDSETCGTGEGSYPGLEIGIVAGESHETLGVIASLSASPNNDCPGTGDQVSVTIESVDFQGNLTLCVPDVRDGGERQVTRHPASAPETRVELVTLIAVDGECMVTAERTDPAGTATLQTQCGTDDLIVSFDAQVSAVRTCPEMDDETVNLSVAGVVLATYL